MAALFETLSALQPFAAQLVAMRLLADDALLAERDQLSINARFVELADARTRGGDAGMLADLLFKADCLVSANGGGLNSDVRTFDNAAVQASCRAKRCVAWYPPFIER